LAGANSQEATVCNRIHYHAKSAVIVVAQCDETERLHHSFTGHLCRVQHLGHAMYWTGLRLEGNLNKVAGGQCPRHSQESTGHRNGLELAFSPLAIFQQDES
jgi:hypothetical protein